MLFKKKRMIDIRELQRRGRIIIPEKDIEIPTDKEGFVDLRKQKPLAKKSFNFFNSPSSTPSQSSTTSFSSESEGYNKREVDEKITELDNKIYKMEQRIELLERKAGVGDSSSSVAPINW